MKYNQLEYRHADKLTKSKSTQSDYLISDMTQHDTINYIVGHKY
jgi:hypothetical protein